MVVENNLEWVLKNVVANQMPKLKLQEGNKS